MTPAEADQRNRVVDNRTGAIDGRPAETAGRAMSERAAPMRNAMTVDVEDYFQVSAFAGAVDRAEWSRLPGRVEWATDRVLGLMDEAGVRATFFTLGWIAERYPALVRRIVAAGHELASHGFAHERVTGMTPEGFRADIRRTRRLLEDVGGTAVVGFRAASFSIAPETMWAYPVLAEEGYRYSSSVYPVRHDHYGIPDAPRFSYRPAGDDGVIEHPVTTVTLMGQNIPCGGGGYFRLAPYAAFRWALRRVNSADARPAIFYFHPWEVDPGQPRMRGAGAFARFRHYVNLGRTEGRLRSLLAEFSWDSMDRVFPDFG